MSQYWKKIIQNVYDQTTFSWVHIDWKNYDDTCHFIEIRAAVAYSSPYVYLSLAHCMQSNPYSSL